jgi:sulfoxide reductase catalytic subunit YedY
MLIRRSRYGIGNIRPSEITGKSAYLNRREFLSLTAAGTLAATVPALYSPIANAALNFSNIKKTDYRVDEEITDKKSVTTYNNFYEFGTDKGDPARNSGNFKPLPWSVKVSGACDKPGDYALEDFVSPHQLEDRVYRFRCVEAWSMVIPWVGIPLADVLKRFEPNSKAKYVSFRTVFRPKEMPGQERSYIPWPYVEGLRIDEAMNPLALLAVGLFGETLPNQNGAPLRLVVPWKYGFKSIKSIVAIEFTETEPQSSWNVISPREYGFYSNVNPQVKHPRWSQAKERRIGEFFKRETLMFNGYADEVAGLYSGMDLTQKF